MKVFGESFVFAAGKPPGQRFHDLPHRLSGFQGDSFLDARVLTRVCAENLQKAATCSLGLEGSETWPFGAVKCTVQKHQACALCLQTAASGSSVDLRERRPRRLRPRSTKSSLEGFGSLEIPPTPKQQEMPGGGTAAAQLRSAESTCTRVWGISRDAASGLASSRRCSTVPQLEACSMAEEAAQQESQATDGYNDPYCCLTMVVSPLRSLSQPERPPSRTSDASRVS